MKINKKDVSTKLYIILFSSLIVIISAIILIYANAGKKQKSYDSTNIIAGIEVQQTVYGNNAERAMRNAAKDISVLESLISGQEGSDVYRINQGADSEWIDIDEKTAEVLDLSLEIAKKSSGAFDPTMKNILDLWGFNSDKQQVPSKTDISTYLPYINYSNLKVNTDVLRARLFKKLSAVDLTAIKDGAACDAALKSYEKSRAHSGIISVGHSVGVYGTKADQTPWRIAIKDPFNMEDKSKNIIVLKLDSGCVSTSSPYEKIFMENKKVYHHIISPVTGYPVNNNIISVSVAHKNGLISDALSLACNVLGIKKSQSLLEYYGADAVFVYKDKKVYATSNIKDKILITDENYTLTD